MNETVEHASDPVLVEALQAAAAHHTQPGGALASVVNVARTAGHEEDDVRVNVEAAVDTAEDEQVRQNLETFQSGLAGGVPELVPPPEA